MSNLRSLRLSSVLSLAFATLVLGGCPASPQKKPGDPVSFSMRRAGDNEYLAGRIKSKVLANSVLILPRDLRPPFRCEVTTGVFDPKRLDPLLGEAIFGMELDTPGRMFPPPEFYGVSVRLFAQGAQVFSGSHLTAPNAVDDDFFNGATMVDLAIEHDGGSVMFFARPHGAGNWTSLGEVNPSGQNFPVHPTVGIFRGAKPGEVGFDDFRVLFNGPRPGGLSPEQTVVEDMWDVLDAQVDVAHSLDGPAPDAGMLATQLVLAEGLLDAAIGDLEAIIAGPVKKKQKTPQQLALKRFRTGLRQLASARKKLEKGKPKLFKAVAKKLEKAVRLQFEGMFGLLSDL